MPGLVTCHQKLAIVAKAGGELDVVSEDFCKWPRQSFNHLCHAYEWTLNVMYIICSANSFMWSLWTSAQHSAGSNSCGAVDARCCCSLARVHSLHLQQACERFDDRVAPGLKNGDTKPGESARGQDDHGGERISFVACISDIPAAVWVNF